MPYKSMSFRGRTLLFYTWLTVFIVATLSASGQMRQVYMDPIDADNEVRSIDFYSPSSGYVTFKNSVGFTTDSGRSFTWKKITVGNVNYDGYPVNLLFGFNCNGVKAINQQTLLAYGEYGFENTILRSTDGGNTFKVILYKPYNPGAKSNGITDLDLLPDGVTGYAVDQDQVFKTTNGGQTWSTAFTQLNTQYNRVQAIDNNAVLAYSYVRGYHTGTGSISISFNAGRSWSAMVRPAGDLYGAYFQTANMGWISLSTGLYQTTNGGVTWVRQDTPNTAFTGKSLYFSDSQTGYAIGEKGNTVYKTTDGGKYWEPLVNQLTIPNTEELYILYGYSASQLWAGGSRGLLQLTTNSGGTPRPNVYFNIDTAGYYGTGKIQLINHSRNTYSFQWFRNDTLVATSNNAVTNGNGYPTTDKITLVAFNGAYTDTLVLYQSYTEPAYATSFTPSAAPTGGTVMIKGTNLDKVTAVYFGGVPASSFQAIDYYTVTAVVGNGASGNISVVTRDRGIATIAGFVYMPPPVITGFTPRSTVAGGTITITGNNFNAVTEVIVGGIRITNYTVVSPTTIILTAPSGPSGNIEVKTTNGTTAAPGYTALPSLKLFSPASGVVGSVLRISGSSLQEVTSITIGGVPVANFTVHSADSITARVGNGTTGSVEVKSAGGSASRPGYTLIEPPVITSFSPQAGIVGTTVTITGSHFDPVAANNIVQFGTVRATVTNASATSLTVRVPGGAIRERISISVRSLTAFSAAPFNTLFTSGGSITPSSFDKHRVLGIHQYQREYLMQGVGDLDGDGKQDIVTTNNAMPFSLLFARNTSSGNSISFEEVAGNQGFATAMVIGDLNGDGKPEMVFDLSGSISIYPNTSSPGHISFEQGISLGGLATEAFGNITRIDIDKDGKPDIVKSATGHLLVYRNLGEPGLFAFETIDIPSSGIDAMAYDMNGDGLPDLVQYDRVGNTITLHRNTSTKGTVSFAAPITLAADSPQAIDISDIDNDGKPDIAIASANSGKLQLFINTSQGANLSFSTPREINIGAALYDVALIDLDGDGLSDLAASSDKYQFTSLINRSTPGNIHFEQKTDHSPDEYVYRYHRFMIQSGDFNGDGRPDLLLLAKNVAQLDLYINQAKGQPYIESWTPDNGVTKGATVTIKGKLFTGTTAVSFGGVPASSFTVVNDSTIQAVLGQGASGMVSVTNVAGATEKAGFLYGAVPFITSFSPLKGPVGSQVVLRGRGFDPVPSNNIVYFGGVKTRAIASTGNTLTVIVPSGGAYPGAFTVTANSRTVSSNRTFAVTFASDNKNITDTSLTAETGIPYSFIGVAADFDQDGRNDLVLSQEKALFAVTRNASSIGKVSFEPAIIFGDGEAGSAYATGDLDGDGRIDVVVTSSSSNLFHVFRNTTIGNQISFTRDSSYSIFEGPVQNGVTIADIDEDGRPEIVGFTRESMRVFVFKNLSAPGRIALAPRLEFYAGGSPFAIAADDLDNDGKKEILSYNLGQYNYGISALRNTGPENTINLESKGGVGFDNAHRYTFGDFDGDGRLDAAGTSHFEAFISIGQNTSTPGNISFAKAIEPIFIRGESLTTLTVADLNGDGKPELLHSSGNLHVFRNISSPGAIALAPRKRLGIIGARDGYYPMDIDGDGAIDLVAGGSVLLNKMNNNAPLPVQLCAGSDTSLQATMVADSYQWQQRTDAAFTDIADNAHFTGTASAKLELKDVPASWNGYQFRSIDNNGNPGKVYKINITNGETTASVIIATPTLEICQGAYVAFTATPVNGGNAPNYQWFINGQVTNATGSTFSTNTLVNGDEVKVSLTSSDECTIPSTVLSNILKMTVSRTLTPSVTISVDLTKSCNGELVKYIAIPVNGGSLPSFSWYKNGIGLYPDSDTLITGLRQGDVVKVALFSNLGCRSQNDVWSNTLTIGGNAPGDPAVPGLAAVSIKASAANICERTEVTFTATPTNGGSSPTYQWQVNGANVGTNSATYAASNLTDGAQVKVLLTSQSACTPTTPISSNTINMVVMGTSAVTATVSGNNTVEANSSTLLAVTVSRTGSNTTYLWQDSTSSLGWQPIAGATSASITYTPAETGDKIRCLVTTNATCMVNNTVTSNVLTFAVNTPNGGRIAPNPVANVLNIGDLSLDDQWQIAEIASVGSGNRVIVQSVAGQTTVSIPVAKLTKGLYVVLLRSKTGATKQIRFIKQ